uniref:NADH dehydrogenase (Ubiquinone) complex I, assembly factor 6 n=1 Tax=Ananas comosus var. bracteatus TaxID=296719 RepID=A0A6V7PK27_ANACO|nr:unnamed protein product [Ananas comosus var. bracteatus]
MNGASTVNNTLRAAFSYCVQQVRSYDYHHYLCLLHLPPAVRRAAFALRALNVETARAMDVASDPKIGLMRLLWWQEAIDKIYSRKLIEHPVAQALSSVVSDHKISKHWLRRSLDARINDANRDDWWDRIYGRRPRGLTYWESKRAPVPYIPADVAEKHGLLIRSGSGSEVRMESGEDLSDVVFEVASAAGAHLQKARELAGTVPAEAVPALLPAVPAQVLLDSLRRRQFNVFDSRSSRGVLGISPLWYQLKLKWHVLMNKY